MTSNRVVFSGAIAVVLGLVFTSMVTGAIAPSGSVLDSAGELYVGYSGPGMLAMDGDSTLTRDFGYIGYDLESDGTATVTGVTLTMGPYPWPAPKLAINSELYVGYCANGTLEARSGGQVTSEYACLGFDAGTIGTVMMADYGSSWANTQQIDIGYYGTGRLDIQGPWMEGGARVSTERLYLGQMAGSKGTVTVSGFSDLTTTKEMVVGNQGNGELLIGSWGQVTSGDGFIGFYSTGTVVVSGGSWTCTGSTIYVGVGGLGRGVLNIENGGRVEADVCQIGHSGKVTVHGGSLEAAVSISGNAAGAGSLVIEDGSYVYGRAGNGQSNVFGGRALVTGNSIWYAPDAIFVNYSGTTGNAQVVLTDGGSVQAPEIRIDGSLSRLRLVVTRNDAIRLGNWAATGQLMNNAAVVFYADAFLTATTYRPIAGYPGRAITFTGTGSYVGIGGTVVASDKSFIVSPATALTAGATDSLSAGERLVFTDGGNRIHAGASFGSISGSTTFSASRLDQTQLDALVTMPGLDGRLLTGWDFTTDLSSQEVLLSFDLGLGYERLKVWHYSGGVWSQYTSDMQTYDSHGVLSFPVTSFSGYAVTGVPEPATLVLLALGGVAVLRRRRRT